MPSGSRKKIIKAIVKPENSQYSQSYSQPVDVKGVPMNVLLPNQDCVRMAREAISNIIAGYMADNPEMHGEWEHYRKSLKDDPLSQ